KIALDSNVLLYIARVWKVEADKLKTGKIETLLLALSDSAEIIVPLQVLGECYTVMQRFGYTRDKCRTVIRDWTNQFGTAASDG
ncbi:MAG: hypothetical protein RL367_156, partial [Pseudomonadota bacterium]